MTSQVLSNNNRFDPMPSSSPYIEDGAFTQEGIPISQGQYGVYDQNAERTSVEDLQKVAYSMLMRASGHTLLPAMDPTSVLARAASVLPSFVQSGDIPVPTSILRAANAYGAPDRPEIENGELLYNDIDGAPLIPPWSKGVLNNPYEKFEHAIIPQVLTGVQSLATMSALGTIFGAVMLIIEAVAVESTPPNPRSPHEMNKGQHRKAVGTAKLLKGLSIPEGLSKPFHECVCWGIAAFFKIPPDDIPPIPIGIPFPAPLAIAAWFATLLVPDPIASFRQMQYASGYYATMMRSIRIDMNQLLSELLDFVPTSPDPEVILYNLINGLNKYRSWRFYCTLAKLGDVYLQAKSLDFAPVKSIDDMPNNGQTRQAKSRAHENRLAWRHRASPSLILLPQKYANAYSLFGFKSDYALNQMLKIGDKTNSVGEYFNNRNPATMTALPPFRRKIVQYAGHRLPKEYVDAVEDELDSEYCPFYFHDLRTNEVISFQAFLESLTDSYSVSYAESAGYGRIDPVKIYQNTSRSISLSWMLVATSPEDFDSMWWSINKLVSMCYPQFSMGKPVKAGKKKFVMPFSQIPTASPVIRLRVGDVIRSNYSRFNLARIFGMSEAIPAASTAAGGPPTVPGAGATGPNADAENAANLAAWAGAPFDLTYADNQEAAQQVANDEAASAHNALIAQINEALSEQPFWNDEHEYGYWPGSIDPNTSDMRGLATLKANSDGYTTYDMDAAKSNPLPAGSYLPGIWPSMFPPPTATSGVLIEATPFRSRFYAPAAVRIVARRVSDWDGNFFRWCDQHGDRCQ